MSCTDFHIRARREVDNGFTLNVDVTCQAHTLAFFGPSGAGKSMLLRAITGLVRCDASYFKIGSRVLEDSEKRLRIPTHQRAIGFVDQDDWLFPLLSVRDNLTFGHDQLTSSVELDEVARALEMEHLLDRRPRSLSGGERQRVAIGRAVLSAPQLLMCDEPFSALDHARRRRVSQRLATLREALGRPMILVSHEIEDILALADYAVIMNNGAVVRHGPVTEVFSPKLERNADTICNYFVGRVHDVANGLAEIHIEDMRIYVATSELQKRSLCRLLIEPDFIALSKQTPTHDSARNHLNGVIVAMRGSGGDVVVTVDVGFHLDARITEAAVRDLELALGSSVTARFKANAVQILGYGH